MTQVSYIHCTLRVRSKAGRCAFSEPCFFKLKLASLFTRCIAHTRRDDSVVVSTSENSCPRNGADGNRDIISTVTRAGGLDPIARCDDDDDVLQLAVIFLLGRRGSFVDRPCFSRLFGPWALVKQGGQLTMVKLRSC